MNAVMSAFVFIYERVFEKSVKRTYKIVEKY